MNILSLKFSPNKKFDLFYFCPCPHFKAMMTPELRESLDGAGMKGFCHNGDLVSEWYMALIPGDVRWS